MAACGVFALVVSTIALAEPFGIISEVVLEESRRWLLLDGGGWVTVEKGRVEFYSPEGERVKVVDRRANEVLAGSIGTRKVGVLAYADNQPQTIRPLTFQIYSPNGDELVRQTDPPFASAIVSPAGNAFIGVDGAEGLPTSLIRLYDDTGTQTDTFTVERYEGGRFTRGGNRFLYESAGGQLKVFDLATRSTTSIGRLQRWGASPDGDLIAGVLGDRLLIYRMGRLAQTLPLSKGMGEIRGVTVSPSGALAAVFSATRALVARTSPPAIVWSTGIGDTTWNFRSADLFEDPGLAAFGIDYDPDLDSPDRHTIARCLVFDSLGALLHTEEDTPAKWAAQFPAVRFDHARGTLAFISRDRMKILSLNRHEP